MITKEALTQLAHLCAALVILTFSSTEVAQARTLYVDVNGNPAPISIAASNYLSSVAVAFRMAVTNASITNIIFYPGQYRETIDLDSIVRTPTNALLARKVALGDPGYDPGMDSSNVMIDGRNTVDSLRTGSWSLDTNSGIWSVALATNIVMDVFYDDNEMIAARWPDIIATNAATNVFTFQNLLTDQAWCRTDDPGTGFWPITNGIEGPFFTDSIKTMDNDGASLANQFPNATTLDANRGLIEASVTNCNCGTDNWNTLAQIIAKNGANAFKQVTLVRYWWNDFNVWTTYVTNLSVVVGSATNASSITQIALEHDMRDEGPALTDAFNNAATFQDTFFLTGSLIFLDHQREWFFDTGTQILYFMPPYGYGTNASDTSWQAHVSVRVRGNALTLNLPTNGNPTNTSYVTLSGLECIGGAVNLLVNNSQNFHDSNVGQTIYKSVPVNHLTITNCMFYYTTIAYPGDTRPYLQSHDPAAYPKNIAQDLFQNGDNNVILGHSVSFLDNELFFGAGSAMTIIGTNCDFENNYLSWFNLLGDDGWTAFWVSSAGANFNGSPYSDSTPATNSAHERIRFNTVLYTGGGAFSGGGMDTEFAYNRIAGSYLSRRAEHDDGATIELMTGLNCVNLNFHHNWISGCMPSPWHDQLAVEGIDLGRVGLGGRLIRLDNGVNGGQPEQLTNVCIHHNVMWDSGGCGILLTTTAGSGFYIFNNTIFNMGRSANSWATTGFATNLTGSAMPSGILANDGQTNAYFFNNIMQGAVLDHGSFHAANGIHSFNNLTNGALVFSNSPNYLVGASPAETNTEYVFAPYPGGGMDILTYDRSFLPANSSPALNAGAITSPGNGFPCWNFVLTNLTWQDSNLVPTGTWSSGNGYVGANPDIGAYENGEWWVPGSSLGGVLDPLRPTPTLPGYALTVPGSVARYEFEGNVLDSSGCNNNALTNNGALFTVGISGAEALWFNGSNAYVSIPRSIATNFTISLWINTTLNGPAQSNWYAGLGLVDGGVAGHTNDFGTALTGTQLAFGAGSASADATLVSSNNVSIVTGNWVHLAATRNASSGLMSTYINGVLEGQTNGPTGPDTSPIVLRIGSLQAGGGYFNGMMDNVMLFTQELSAAQIAVLATPPSQGTGPQQLGINPPVPGFNSIFDPSVPVSITYNNPGLAAMNWTVPSGVTSVQVYAWGGGGGGGGANNGGSGKTGGGGGAGGAFVGQTLSVNAGDAYAIVVGAGGVAGGPNSAGSPGGYSYFSNVVSKVVQVFAVGGMGGTNGNSTVGGGGGMAATNGCIGTTVYPGGSGGNGKSGVTQSGGGGGAAGSEGAGGGGGNGVLGGGTGGLGGAGTTSGGTTDGGAGGSGVGSAANGIDGSAPGGGGGGAAAGPAGNTQSGGAGGTGQVTLTYFADYVISRPTGPLLSGSLSGGSLLLTWPTIANQNYQLETKTNLTDASWSPLGSPVLANGNVLSFTNNLPTAAQQFYRVEQVGP